MRKWRFIRRNEGKRLTFYYANIGDIAASGFPANNSKIDQFPNYSKKVFENYKKDYDVILIDERFRVACALQTILNTKEDAVILWHDFLDRPYYHEILDFLDIKKSSNTMVVLKKKNNINKKEVEKMYKKYKYDVR